MLPILWSEPVVSEDVASRLLAEFYDGDSASLFKLLMGQNASDSVRFWQWRTLIRVAINNEIDYDFSEASLHALSTTSSGWSPSSSISA